MTKRIIELTKGEFGFSETHSTLTPIEKRYQRADDAFPQFMDINVKQLLDRAKTHNGWVMLINETKTTYSSERIHACPECGWPMRRQGRHTTYRYVCARAEAWRDAGLGDDKKHAYVRSWTHEELEPAATLSEAIAVALTGTPDPVCSSCGDPAFASVGGRLLCRTCY